MLGETSLNYHQKEDNGCWLLPESNFWVFFSWAGAKQCLVMFIKQSASSSEELQLLPPFGEDAAPPAKILKWEVENENQTNPLGFDFGGNFPGSCFSPPCATPRCVCPFFACRKASEWCSRWKVSLDKHLNFWIWTPDLRSVSKPCSSIHTVEKNQSFSSVRKTPSKTLCCHQRPRDGNGIPVWGWIGKKDSEGDHVNSIPPSFLPLNPGALITSG